MRYPKMRGSSPYKVNIPKLNGGLNLSNNPYNISDNQLSECENVWWYNDRLQVRPGFNRLKDSGFGYTLNSFGFTDPDDICTNHTDIYCVSDGDRLHIDCFWTSSQIQILVHEESNSVSNSFIAALPDNGYRFKGNCVLYGGRPTVTDGIGVYILVGAQKTADGSQAFFVYEVRRNIDTSSQDAFLIEKITEDKYYIPLVMINGKGQQYSSLPTFDEAEYASSTLLEGYNLLTGKYRATYICDGVSYQYKLPMEKPTGEIVIETIDSFGNWWEAYRIQSNSTIGQFKGGDTNYFVEVNRESGMLTFKQTVPATELTESYVQEVPLRPATFRNTIRITAESAVNYGYLEGLSFSEKFGGAKGLNGGSRTFFGGNKKWPNIMIWTDENEPLYFPENNYAAVGDDNQAITAFGKQGESLVIFKEHEIYYTTYVEGDSYNADDVYSGAVIDIASTSAKFPIMQIHSSIGCDLGKTIQLCANRLIWATTDGKVYTLSSRNMYSEMNVMELSELIETDLRKKKFDNAFAIDWEGRYLLFVAQTAYILDYSSSAYQYISSSYDSDKRQKMLSWHKWVFPSIGTWRNSSGAIDIKGGEIYSGYLWRGNLCLMQSYRKVNADASLNDVYVYLTKTNVAQSSTDSWPIPWNGNSTENVRFRFATKIFDFGNPEFTKTVSQIYISAGNYDDPSGDELYAGDVEVTYLTDVGELDDMIQIRAKDWGGAYGMAIKLRPCISRIRSFGIRFSGSRKFALDGCKIQYKVLRGVE